MNTSSLSDRIRWVMQRFDLSQSELARIAGIKQPSVAGWLSGKTKNLKSGPALAICTRLPICQSWLVNGVGDPVALEHAVLADSLTNVVPYDGRLKPIPLLQFERVGDMLGTGRFMVYQDAYDHGDVIWVDDDVSEECFALRVSGSSMEPDFRENDEIVIDPSIRPCPGDFVVALRVNQKTGESETVFNKYRSRGCDMNGTDVFELIPLNDDYPAYNSQVEKLTLVGVVIEHRRSYRNKRRNRDGAR